MTDHDALKRAIENLSDKQHVVSEDARRAKDNGFRHDVPHLARTNVLLSEVNKSSRYLMGVFQQSEFDSLFLFLARPFQLFMMQFMVGVIRGLGLLFGILLFFILILDVCQTYLPDTFFIQLYDFIRLLKK